MPGRGYKHVYRVLHDTKGERPLARSVDETFPHLAEWVKTHGWVEIGYDDARRSFIRALDNGGVVWEGDMVYDTLDSALEALDDALAIWVKENGEHE